MATAKKILVVDDNVDAADMMAYFLQMHGLEVQVTYGGLRGLAAARAEHPSLMFLDIGMPFMDGCEVAKAIRADLRRPLKTSTGFAAAPVKF
jgi:DNA-binding response OmpR family regulator